MSNLPSGVSPADIDRHFGGEHDPRCVFHEDYNGPNLACADDHYLRESDFVKLAGSPPLCPVWYSVGERCGAPVREVPCSCDQLASAYAEDAAEHQREEDEGR